MTDELDERLAMALSVRIAPDTYVWLPDADRELVQRVAWALAESFDEDALEQVNRHLFSARALTFTGSGELQGRARLALLVILEAMDTFGLSQREHRRWIALALETGGFAPVSGSC